MIAEVIILCSNRMLRELGSMLDGCRSTVVKSDAATNGNE